MTVSPPRSSARRPYPSSPDPAAPMPAAEAMPSGSGSSSSTSGSSRPLPGGASGSSSATLPVLAQLQQLEHAGSSSGGSGGTAGASFKRARTASPATDDASSSEPDVERRTTFGRAYSESSESVADGDAAAAAPGQSQASALPTPLRLSFAQQSLDNSAAAEAPAADASMADAYKSISAEPPSFGASAAPGSLGALPSYSDAMQQSVSCHTPGSLTPALPDGSADGAGVAPGLSPELAARIKALCNEPLALDQRWYVVSARWYAAFEKACAAAGEGSADAKKLTDEVDIAAPGPISSLDLQDDRAQLRLNLVEDEDFVLLPEVAYASLSIQLGEKQPEIVRSVIKGFGGELRVELYPPSFRLYQLPKPNSGPDAPVRAPVRADFSITTPINALKFAAKRTLLLDESIADADVRFWRLPADDSVGNGFLPLPLGADVLVHDAVELIKCGEDDGVKRRDTLRELQLDEPVIHLAVERRGPSGWLYDQSGRAALPSVKGIFAQAPGGDYLASRFQSTTAPPPPPRPLMSNVNTLGSASGSGQSAFGAGRVTRSQTSQERHSGPRGLTGLYNLGNTCFMASALQCLSNTVELRQYFVTGVYRGEINADNPLGMGGQVAMRFGELLEKLWAGGNGAVHPREFKQTLSRFAPQFSGYAQQDTQELLAFLLDGLHEDLNRIRKKPYVEAPDWEGGDEREMVAFAKRQWEIYKMRNDSVIVDLFQGQYRSTLVCPECDKVSVKFDPFMYLTLPVPNRKKISRKVHVQPADPTRPTYELEVGGSAETTYAQAKERIGGWLDIDPKRFAPACDIFSGQIYAAIPDYEALASIAQNDYICLYELEGEYTPPTAEVMRDHGGEDGKPPVEEYATLPVFSVLGKDYGRKDTIGVPFFISVPRAHVSDEAYIRDVLISKFMRHATSEGAEILEEYRTSSSAAAAGQQQEQAAPPAGDWEMVDADAAPHATPPQADPSVADLPSSEESTPPVPGSFDASGSANQAPSRDANGFDGAQAIAEDANAVSAFQPLENASQPRRQKALFTVSFTARRERDSTFPRSGDNVGEPLAERSARRQAALSSAAGTASPPQDADETIMADAAGAEPWPLVYTGGALVCTWSHNASTAVFGSDIPTKHPWGASEKVVDPDLVREREDAANRGAGYRAPQLSIDDCLDEFTKEEKLGADDPWYCPTCKEFRQATKKFDLWKAPDILVVHLKRFSGGRMQSRDKIEDLIDFPIEGLDLTRRVEGAKAVANLQARGEEVPSVFNLADSVGSVASDLNDDAVAADAPIYDLYAVDNHFGGLGGGHYTAFAKNAEDGLWHNYDDSSVSLVAEPERVKTKAAYLLFYRRRTTRPIGGKSREKTDVAVSRGSTATLNEASSDEAYTPFSSGTDATMRDVRGATPAPFATMPSSLYVSSGPNDGLYPDDEYDLYGPAQPPTPAAYDSDAPGDASRVPWAASTFAPRRNSQASTASAEAAYDSSPGSPNIDSSRRSSFDSRPHGPGPSLDDEEFEVESD